MGSEYKKAPNRRNAKRQTAPKKPTEKAVTKPYEPTPQERSAIAAYLIHLTWANGVLNYHPEEMGVDATAKAAKASRVGRAP